MPELKNRQHELFARAYIATYGNRRQAAIDAGYSVHTAARQGVRLSQYADVYDSGKKTAAEVGGDLLRELSLK